MSGRFKIVSTKAMEARRDAGISPVSPIDVWKLIQNSGVSLIKEPLESRISGLFLRKGDVEVILVNTQNTLGHQNFTAAHEYYHLKYNPELTARACTTGQFDSKNIIEQEADHFAAHLLAPDDAVNYFLNKRFNWIRSKPTLSHIIALEQYLGISRNAVLIRLEQTGWISRGISQFRTDIIKNARELGYDTSLYRPTMQKQIISDYAEKAKKALDSELITPGKYEELLLEAGLGDLLFDEELEDAEIFF